MQTVESITAGKGVFDNPLTVIIGGKRHRIEADTDGRGNHSVKVTLQRESANPYDSNAVCILSPAGQVMGYLARADAKA